MPGKARGDYHNNPDETYNNSGEIAVNIYFLEVNLVEGVFDKTRLTGQKYVLHLRSRNNILTFKIEYNNLIFEEIINIENGIPVSCSSKTLASYLTGTVYTGAYPGPLLDYKFILLFDIEDYNDLTTFKEGSIKVIIEQGQSEGNLRSINNLIKHINQETDVQISYQTDNLGVNLGEMVCIIISDHSYPNGFPKDLIGYCKKLPTTNTQGIDTFYSFRPKLSKVLKLNGTTLLDQTNKINKEFNNIKINNYKENCIFFNSILAYSTLRYMFAGLSNNSVFSCKWLYSNNYKKFLRILENSEFSAAVPLFTQPQKGFDFSDYNKYYRECPHK